MRNLFDFFRAIMPAARPSVVSTVPATECIPVEDRPLPRERGGVVTPPDGSDYSALL